MDKKRRVVVTGIGAITPVGIGVEVMWEKLLAGQSGVGAVTRFDAADFACKIAAEVKDFDAEAFLDKKEAKRMDLFSQYAVTASILAAQDGDFAISEAEEKRVGVILGTGIGGMTTFETQCRNLQEKGPRKVSPFTVPMMIVNMAAGQIAIAHQAKGPNLTVVSACASGTNAIGEAFRLIRDGVCDAMFTGGTEAAITPLAFAGFGSAKALCTTSNDAPEKASRPFDQNRSGFVMGEGAVILLLEELAHAQKRGAKIYAEVAGYGFMADAYHITAPAPDASGIINAMEAALGDAGISAEAIDYINAHGTSTAINDKVETQGIKAVFGHETKVAVSSTKSMTGHLLGAAGALEGAVLALAIRDNVVPPTINYETADPECDLDYVPGQKRMMTVNYAMSNSLGFGGQNAVIIMKKPDC